MHNIDLSTPVKDPKTDQSMDVTKVQLGKPVMFLEVDYRSMGEGFLTGTEMTQRTALPRPTLLKSW